MILLNTQRQRARLRIKFVAKEHGAGTLDVFQRQLPGADLVWGDCQFLFDPDEPCYDWLVCYDDLAPLAGERFSSRVERLACPREHTLFITVEPSSIKVYGKEFLEQFGVVLTSQEPWAIGTNNVVFSQPALRWYYGAGQRKVRRFDAMQAERFERKPGVLSTVCSNKRHHCTLHARRYDFTMALAERFPFMEVYGRGVRPLDDKADAVAPYQYHLAMENHLAPHHWTEKLADTFLGMALPLYVGCPNVADYFPAESVIMLDVENVEASVSRIEQAIRDNEYARRRAAIGEARRRVLEQYNLFAVIARMIAEKHDSSLSLRDTGELLYSRHAIRQQGVLHAFRFAVERMRTRGRARRLVRQFVRNAETIQRTTT